MKARKPKAKTPKNEPEKSLDAIDSAESGVRMQIITKARGLFFASGFRGVTMDDISRELGMSKKTLYQNFSGKDELLCAVIAAKFDQIEKAFDSILHDELSITEQIRLVLEKLHSEAAEVQPAFVRDVQRGDPALFQSIDKRRTDIIRKYLGHLIERGCAEGVLRKNLRPDLLIHILLTVVQQVVTPANLARHNLSPNQAFEQVMGVFLHGIMMHPGPKG